MEKEAEASAGSAKSSTLAPAVQEALNVTEKPTFKFIALDKSVPVAWDTLEEAAIV
jgi:hypothetical protein